MINQFDPLHQNVRDNRHFMSIATSSKGSRRVKECDYDFACCFAIFGGLVQINPQCVGNLTDLKLTDLENAIPRDPEGKEKKRPPTPWVVQIGQATKTPMHGDENTYSLVVKIGRSKAILREWVQIRRRYTDDSYNKREPALLTSYD